MREYRGFSVDWIGGAWVVQIDRFRLTAFNFQHMREQIDALLELMEMMK